MYLLNILEPLLCLLSNILDSKEAKQRLNRLLEEYAPHFTKIEAPKEKEITQAILIDSVYEILMEDTNKEYLELLIEHLFKKDNQEIEPMIKELIKIMNNYEYDEGTINKIKELFNIYKTQANRTASRLIDDVSTLLIKDILDIETLNRVRKYTVKTHPPTNSNKIVG